MKRAIALVILLLMFSSCALAGELSGSFADYMKMTRTPDPSDGTVVPNK